MPAMNYTDCQHSKHRMELYLKLGEAENLDACLDEGITHAEIMKRLRERIK